MGGLLRRMGPETLIGLFAESCGDVSRMDPAVVSLLAEAAVDMVAAEPGPILMSLWPFLFEIADASPNILHQPELKEKLHTLCDASNTILLENISFPEPVISVSIEPKTTADQDKMAEALRKLSEEDPTFVVRSDEETGQTIISGMGELHLEVLVDRMLREFRVQARVGRPQVAYRESITTPVEKAEYRYVKQTGGRGHYGHVVLAIEPGEVGSGIVFESQIVGGSIPKEYIPAVEKGVREAALGGVIAGYPLTDVKVRLHDGSYHEVDSNEMAFKLAGSMAFREGAQKAGPILQEPIMKAEILAPEEFLGDIIGQINARRGEILGMEIRPGNVQAVRAMVPLAEMFGYATDLRSATQGRGVFTIEFDHYARVAENVARAIMSGGYVYA